MYDSMSLGGGWSGMGKKDRSLLKMNSEQFFRISFP